MKNWYQSLPLHSKQTLIIIVINALTLLIASTLYFYNNIGTYQKSLIQQLEATSQIVAGNTTSALLFEDKHAAHQQLQSIIKDSSILYVGIFDNQKSFFTNYDATSHYVRPDFSQYQPGIYYHTKKIEMVEPIYYDKELLGYVLVVKDTSALFKQLSNYAWITAGVFFMSLIFAWGLSAVMQRWLSKPIKDFSNVIRAITRNKDYSQRLNPEHNDEIGALMGSFNTMLDAVQERDDKLRAHGEELEDLVNLRTRQLHQRSNYDGLTKLPNRHFFIEQLEHQIENAAKEKQHIAVLFLDLDRFKIINDNLGHSVGDQVLKVAAERIENILKAKDNVARWGGDEFVIFLNEVSSKAEVERISQSIISQLEKEIQLANRQFHISCSIGISLYPNNGNDVFTLLKNADISMHKAKLRGPGSFCFYRSDMDETAVDRLTTETKLRRALENNLFTMVYQPKINIKKNELSGVEALIRWHDEDLGAVPPSQFIPLAEEIGIINKIGDFVIQTSCRQHAQWRAMGLPPIRIAINLSPSHLSDPKIVEQILCELDFYQMEPQHLELEITEETFLDSSEQCKKNLSLLNKFGVHISIDDFGTGYSCLSYLLDLPVTTLKIDGSFVKKLGTKKENDGIVHAIMTLGHGLGLEVVAECVETEEQLNFLKENNCDVIQGFYFSKPLMPNDLADYVKQPNF